ncbi:MAG: non-canonical purine pyrophosphatase, rdgB/HAM1 family [Bryobacterales bacterium]|nr:non-canonical purine pyrophosphatase, rdgB/HAM1 family [Bryobacterales bacterium]
MKLYCATGNPGKLKEFRLAGQVLNIDIEPLPGLKSIEAPEETGDTFEANAVLKAEYYSRLAPGPLFADDSGLEVDALGGEPGVLSARYAGPAATDEDNNRLLLRNLEPHAGRTGRFVCVIALAQNGNVIKTFRGTVEGEILREARGPGGFGYDPLFYYPPFGCSFGEVEGERKFAVSHRGNALRLLLDHLSTPIRVAEKRAESQNL